MGEIVPLLPETEFASTVRAVGVADAGWLVEFASAEQRVAEVQSAREAEVAAAQSRFAELTSAMDEKRRKAVRHLEQCLRNEIERHDGGLERLPGRSPGQPVDGDETRVSRYLSVLERSRDNGIVNGIPGLGPVAQPTRQEAHAETPTSSLAISRRSSRNRIASLRSSPLAPASFAKPRSRRRSARSSTRRDAGCRTRSIPRRKRRSTRRW